MCFTAYATAGKGINLQYHVEGVGDVDFDGIYLDLPRNIITRREDSFDSEQALSKRSALFYRIAEIQYLFNAGELSPHDMERYMESCMGSPETKKATHPRVGKNIYTTRSVLTSIAGVLVQALGRVTRTKNKRPTLHVLLDPDILSMVHQVQLPADMVVPAVYEKIQELSTASSVTPPVNSEQWALMRQMQFIQESVVEMVRQGKHGYVEEFKDLWNAIRHETLVRPTATSVHERPENLRQYFITAPDTVSYPLHYAYQENDDFMNTVVIWDRAHPPRAYREISEASSGLTDIMTCPPIRDGFEKRGYATSWKNGNSIMSPYITRSVYQGAIGEQVVKIVFEDILGVELQHLHHSIFEKFDWCTQGGLYIDSKFWRHDAQLEFNPVERQKYLENTAQKLVQCGGAHALVIRTHPVSRAYPIMETDPGVPPSVTVVNRLLVYDVDGVRVDQEAIELLQELSEQ